MFLVQPPVLSNSFGAGHAGVAYDVELMQQGWLEARGPDSAIFEQVTYTPEYRMLILSTRVTDVCDVLGVSHRCYKLCTYILFGVTSFYALSTPYKM